MKIPMRVVKKQHSSTFKIVTLFVFSENNYALHLEDRGSLLKMVLNYSSLENTYDGISISIFRINYLLFKFLQSQKKIQNKNSFFCFN